MTSIAIVGTADSRMHLPVGDGSWDEIWSQHTPVGLEGHWTRWFEMHDIDALPSPKWDHLRDFLFALDGSRPVYMQTPHPKVKGSVAYPLERILDRFGPHAMTSTVAFEMGLALDEMRACDGPHRIGLFGIEMALASEYGKQRPGIHQMMWIARSMGVEVVLPASSDLLSAAPLYGYGHRSPGATKAMMKRDELLAKYQTHNEGLVRAQAEAADHQTGMSELAGMIDMINYQLDNGWF